MITYISVQYIYILYIHINIDADILINVLYWVFLTWVYDYYTCSEDNVCLNRGPHCF